MLPKYDEDSPKRQAYNTLDPYANMDWLSEYDSPKEAEQDGGGMKNEEGLGIRGRVRLPTHCLAAMVVCQRNNILIKGWGLW